MTPKRDHRLTATGYATRRDRSRARLRHRVQEATTAEDQLAGAYDWFRSEVARIKDAGARAGRLRDVAEYLFRLADEISKEDH